MAQVWSLQATDFQQLTEVQHLLQRPDMYIGPVERIPRMAKCMVADDKIQVKSINTSMGQEHIFVEIMGNVADNVQRSRENNVDPGVCEVFMDPNWITVRNYGMFIPIERHPQSSKWIPDMIFGNFRAGSNFDDKKVRLYIGKNGIGAKGANGFCLSFQIECADPIRAFLYKQEWRNNMSQKTEPEITPYQGIGYTQIKYHLDFARFGVQCYDSEAVEIYRAHCAGLSYACQIPVYFNGTPVQIADLFEYSKFYFPINKSSAICYKDPAGAYELCIVDTPNEAVAVSFVNGIHTPLGGAHLNAAYHVVTHALIDFLGKACKGISLTKRDIVDHVSIFVACRVGNPKFTSQTKEELKSPEPKMELPEKLLATIKKWDLIKILYQEIERKQLSKLKKTDGKRKRFRGGNAEPANWAGGPNAMQTVFILTEGLSADSYRLKFISQIPNGQGRNIFGSMPLSGKPRNVLNADFLKILEDENFKVIKGHLGLSEEIDYTVPENFQKLNYGSVWMFPDPDNDGRHILGLVLLFFAVRFFSLVKMQYIRFLRIPVARTTINGVRMLFYTMSALKRELAKLPPGSSVGPVDYFKGLGSSEDHHIKEDFAQPKIIAFDADQDAVESLLRAFHKSQAHLRKDLILSWLDQQIPDMEKYALLPITTFIHYELIEYWIENVIRSIPEAIDGLKESQRKALFAAMKKLGGKGAAAKKVKVAQVASHAAEITCYKHGETCLSDTIVMMTFNFVGSNNLPYFEPKGQFGCVDPATPILTWNGTRKYAKDITTNDVLIGDDGAPRHISKVVSGTDHMYNINQQYGNPYRVNSEHILTLHFPKHKVIYWYESSFTWSMEYFDLSEKKVKSKTIRCNDSTKDAAEKRMRDFAATIPDNNIFDINIQTYLSFPKGRQSLFRSVRSVTPVKWPKRDIPIDPYILGMWLGDGLKNGRGFASADAELVKSWVVWLDTIGVEVVHNKNKNGHEGYQYGFRRRGTANWAGELIAVGHKDHSSKTCGGCLTSAKLHPACDWVYEEKPDSANRVYDSVAANGMIRDDMNPFVNILKQYGLHNNKWVPELYIINDVETRLQLLAGLIDTDGCLKFRDREAAQFFEISQEVKTHGHIIDAAEYIAKSLGFKTVVSINAGKTSTQKVLSINGDIYRIPTRLPRKRATKTTCEGYLGEKIDIQYAGVGEYVGWYIDSNERFLLGDFTVTHNTRNKGGDDAAQTRYTSIALSWWLPLVIRKEDKRLEKRIEDEGSKQECENFFPTTPLHLINGQKGVGSGWSSDIPPHNPLDIAFWQQVWLLRRLFPEQDYPYPTLRPWFKGFKGQIVMKKEGFTTEGIMQYSPDKSIRITELPVGVWTQDYTANLDEWVDEGLISEWDTFCTDTEVNFYIHKWLGDGIPTLKKLKLTSDFSYKNMTVLYRTETRGVRPKIYNNVPEMMEDFCQLRLHKYVERKALILKEIEGDVLAMESRARYIHLVAVEKSLEIRDRDEEAVLADMTALGLPVELLDNVKGKEFTRTRISDLQRKIEGRKQEKSLMEQLRPERIFYDELEEFITGYCKHEKCQRSTYESCNPLAMITIGQK